MLPLTTSRTGENVNICSLDYSRNGAMRLRFLGCVEENIDGIISNQENVVIQVGDSSFASNGKLARNIFVRPGNR